MLSRSRVDAFPRRISLLVSEHVHFCARRSPSAAELVRREVRPGVFEVTCALILSDIKEAFGSFQNVHPELHISREEFRMSLPWNVRAPAELHCWALATGSSYRAGQQPRVRTVPWCMCEGCSLQRLADTDWVENGQAMFRREIQSPLYPSISFPCSHFLFTIPRQCTRLKCVLVAAQHAEPATDPCRSLWLPFAPFSLPYPPLQLLFPLFIVAI